MNDWFACWAKMSLVAQIRADVLDPGTLIDRPQLAFHEGNLPQSQHLQGAGDMLLVVGTRHGEYSSVLTLLR